MRFAGFIARDSRHHAQRVVEMLFELGDVIQAHQRTGIRERGHPLPIPLQNSRTLRHVTQAIY